MIEDPSCKTTPNLNDLSYSEAESMDNNVIRHKIQQANQLIDRVKKALDKMKSAKQIKRESEEAEKQVHKNNSSSTDIEETIQKLKRETDWLINGDVIDANCESEFKRPKTRKCCREKVSEENQNVKRRDSQKDSEPRSCRISTSINKTFIKNDIEEPTSNSSNESTSEAKSIPNFEKDLENARTRSIEPGTMPDCCRNLDKLELDRPKTRRNEAEDDLSESLRLERFRSCPEDGQVVVTSSLEALQAKLQTISESNESSFSSPRNNRKDQEFILSKEVKCCGVNTDNLRAETKETQVTPERKSIGFTHTCPCEDKGIQTSHPTITLTANNIEAASVDPSPIKLETRNLETQEIRSEIRRCVRCEVESLPVVEVTPAKKAMICEKCKKILKEEHLGGVSIPSKFHKLQKLTIQLLPLISINQRMVVKQVLNFYISPEGDTQNFLQGTENIAFITVKKSSNDHNSPNTNNIGNTEFFIGNTKEEIAPDLEERIVDGDAISIIQNENEENVILNDYDIYNEEVATGSNSVSNGDLEKEVEDPAKPVSTGSNSTHDSRAIRSINSKFFLKLKDDLTKNLDLTENVGHNINWDEDTKNKLLVYKSYHLYDNPNRHDPGSLDNKSCEKLSRIDLNFYRTFINPSGMVSEQGSPFRSRVAISGYETKEVQCNSESLTMATEAVSIPPSMVPNRNSLFKKRASSKKLVFKALDPDTPRQSQNELTEKSSPNLISNSDMKQREADSEVTVLMLQGMDPKTSSYLMTDLTTIHSTATEYSSPSEITVTISYSESSEGSENIQENLYNESRETEIKSTTLSSKLKSMEASPNVESRNGVKTGSPNTEKSFDLASPQIEQETRNREAKLYQPEEPILEVDKQSCDSNKSNIKHGSPEDLKVVLTLADKDVIQRLHEKLKSVDLDTSDPVMRIKEESSNTDTVYSFLKGLTRLSTRPDPSDVAELASNGSQHSTNENAFDVNYHLIDTQLHTDVKAEVNIHSEPLAIATNGRYKDEENMFAQSPYPKAPLHRNRSTSPKVQKEIKNQVCETREFKTYPRHSMSGYCPDTTNSDTVTTNTLSEGDTLCKHSISSGEVHISKHERRQTPQFERNHLPRSNLTKPSRIPNQIYSSPRNILPRGYFTSTSMSLNHGRSNKKVGSIQSNLKGSSKITNCDTYSDGKHFSLTDPKVTIEKKRNYFNNWVTYYVKAHEVNDSSTSNCSQNK